jgi:N-acetylglucosaminyldiphosphoundecaprenol N-acetyl-beta-D-mannosaminyltransferase
MSLSTESTLPSETLEPLPLAEAPVITALKIPETTLLGVRFHSLTLANAVEILSRFIDQKTPRQICLSNAYTVALCRKDAALRSLLNKSGLVLADGMSIVWGGRWVGARMPERVAGPDLMKALCREAVTRGHRIFLLGGDAANLEALERTLQKEYPSLHIAGTYSPSFCQRICEEENKKIIQMLEEVRPDILFVGLSAPKQEKWIADNLHRLPVPVSIGVGAAFDFLSGRIPRAPLWIQRIGLEWLYRLYCEPRRLWRRYLLGNVVFISLLLKELFAQKLSYRRPKHSSD